MNDKDWNFNQPLKVNQKIKKIQIKLRPYLKSSRGNDVNYEAAFQKRKQAPVTESNFSSKPKVTEVRTGKRQISLPVISNILKDLLR
ncbi:MAG: hypothetical protein ACLRVZ_01275 [Turicibacter sp.]